MLPSSARPSSFSRRAAALSSVLLLAVPFPALAARPYRGGVVATAHPLASQAALSMLEKGGNATDAAIAAAFVLSVVGPYHSGIGGGGFALVHDAKTKKTTALDFRETAPAAATRDMYLKDGQVVPGASTDGALSVAVPGAAKGYLELIEKHGKLPRATVLAPAIAAAKKGFWVTPKYRQIANARLECLRQDAEASRLFLRPGPSGQPEAPEIGTVLVQPELAQTMTELARGGAKSFYSGRIAKAMVATLASKGGILTAKDLANYKTRERAPLEGSYRGHRILTFPPPSAGGLAVVQVLGALEKLGPNPYGSAESFHRYAEAVRRVYVDRAKYLGDPDFTQIPLAQLVSPEAIATLARSIDPAKATKSESLLPAKPGTSVEKTKGPVPHPEGEKKNTTHISVIDKDGNAVTLTTTVNYGFGSCVVAKGTGVLLNDEMDDFAMKPMEANVYGLVTGEANAIAPKKVPLSSMSPTLVFAPGEQADKVMLAVGSPGGPTIPTTVIQVILNVIDHKMDVVRAVGEGRLHHQYLPDQLMVDRFALEPATEAALKAKGHVIGRSEGWGDAEAVMVDPKTGLRYAGSDPRNEGAALGQD